MCRIYCCRCDPQEHAPAASTRLQRARACSEHAPAVRACSEHVTTCSKHVSVAAPCLQPCSTPRRVRMSLSAMLTRRVSRCLSWDVLSAAVATDCGETAPTATRLTRVSTRLPVTSTHAVSTTSTAAAPVNVMKAIKQKVELFGVASFRKCVITVEWRDTCSGGQRFINSN